MALFDDILSIGREALASGLEGATVALKTNYGPEINIPVDGGGRNLLGIRAGLIIRNRNGAVIETLGDPAPTDPLRFAAVVAIAAAGVIVLIRGLRP